MTRQYNDDPSKATEFSHWLRKLESPLDSQNMAITNLDYIVHHYRTHWFMTIEEKRYGASPNFSQSQTFSLIESIIYNFCKDTGYYDYRGHFYIIFSHTSPADSKWITIKGKNAERRYTQNIENVVKEFLATGKLPEVIEIMQQKLIW